MTAYRLELAGTLDQVRPEEWDALAAPAGCLLSHAFLHGLEATGCVGEEQGWIPRHALLREAASGALAGAAPLYLKTHSYGEYVFDWAWADAYARHGLRYYPKWLCAVPFTPVGGMRLLAREDAARQHLAQALAQLAGDSGASSMHVLFPTEAEARCLRRAGFMVRAGTQFHWRNAGWRDFDEFLDSLSQPKRKKIRAERRKVEQAGVRVRVLQGADIGEQDWRFFYRCYANTYLQRAQEPYLRPAFFLHLGQQLPAHCVMAQALLDGQPVAASLLLRDAPGGEPRLYGRYWGALAEISCLHFELCYYTPIEWAIGQGIRVFEGGAQGEHKLARGLMPVATRSAHWLAHPAFAQAVEDFLRREAAGLDAYMDELNEHTPYRR
ncbi:GNAT family N-acetyltransferase [Orrella sp. JC864]|uniref:GNAT family N-acetyltransferase n=1 Tax=Orrella sp. JC864 TaxID=3120298 RepID=UPI00300B2BBB